MSVLLDTNVVLNVLRHPSDERTIGLLLCRDRNRVVVEYALRDVAKPLGVADYRLAGQLPDELRGRLPSVNALEAELQAATTDLANENDKGHGDD